MSFDHTIYDSLDLRELQKESARALSVMQATNNRLSQFNTQAEHDSQNWYRAIIKWYIEEYGGLPSEVGPAAQIKLVTEN